MPEPKRRKAKTAGTHGPIAAALKTTRKSKPAIKEIKTAEPAPKSNAVAKPTGRPSTYRPEYADQAHNLALLGLTEDTIAATLEITTKCLNAWKYMHPAFGEALKRGKQPADGEVVRSLYERATGYRWTEQQAFKVKRGKDIEEIQVIEVERRVPPETVAGIFWLKNRQRENWRDKHEVDVTNRYTEINDEQRLEWAERIVERARRLLQGPVIDHEPEGEK
jgi:hypothetical protein